LSRIAECLKRKAADLLAELPLIADLPIKHGAQEFFDALASNQVVIVQAETGSGKSTGLPALLVRAGLSVLHTQPRIIAARGVASRLAQVLGEKLGGVVGWRTAMQKTMDGPDTRCLVVTDGLAMVRRVLGHERWFDVVIIDEVHEWNTNVEILIAWIRRQIKQGARFKVVLMSATMESQRLAEYFGGAPIVNIEGRTFPVEIRKAGESIEEDAAELLNAGLNVLIFQPGKNEIHQCIDTLAPLVGDVVILPLHAELSPDEQQQCFRTYRQPKCIVATNVAQTSITIADIDAVVDSGMERRTEVRSGVEGLYLRSISIADRLQRMGRAARTKKGIYIDHCPDALGGRPKFPIAEIMRSLLDQTFLRLARSGVDLQQLELFHQPSTLEIRTAKSTLRALGCLEDPLTVTELGEEVSRLPTGIRHARMIVEGSRNAVLGDVLILAAIMEQGGIVSPSGSWRSMIEDKSSDLLAQLQIFKHVRRNGLKGESLASLGVNPSRYRRALEHLKLLKEAVTPIYGEPTSNGNRDKILKCICAALIDSTFNGSHESMKGGDQTIRTLGKDSIVSAFETEDDKVVLLGVPFDLDHNKMVHLATIVEHQWLLRHGGDLLKEQFFDAEYEPESDCVYADRKVSFGDVDLVDDRVRAHGHPEAPQIFADWCADQMTSTFAAEPKYEHLFAATRSQQMRARRLNSMAKALKDEQAFPVLTRDDATDVLLETLQGARCMNAVPSPEVFVLPPLDEELAAAIEAKFAEHQAQLAALVPEWATNSEYQGEQIPPARAMSLLGKQMPVFEPRSGKPYVEIPVTPQTPLHELPDDGILDNGQPLQVQLRLPDGKTIIGTHVGQLKQDVRKEFIRICLASLHGSPVAREKLAPLRQAAASDRGYQPMVNTPLCVDPVSAKAITAYGTLKPGSNGQLRDLWVIDHAEAEQLHRQWLNWLTAYRERQAKRLQYKQQAQTLIAAMRCLLVELAGTQLKVIDDIQPCIAAHQQLSFNRDVSVIRWLEEATKLVDKANKAAVAQVETRRDVASNLLERLMRLPESTEGYASAFDCIGALESIPPGTDVSRKVETLLAARAAVSACGGY
jgi:HrpA-like RNA helicase